MLFMAAVCCVSCESDDPASDVKPVGVEFQLPDVLSCMGGEGFIPFTIHTPIEGEELSLSASSEPWLYNLSVDEERSAIKFYYDRYDVEEGTPARQTSFTVYYGALEPYTITLTQAAPHDYFEVIFLEMAPDYILAKVIPESESISYLIGCTSEAEIERAGSIERVIMTRVNGYADNYYGDILDSYLLTGTYPQTEEQEPITCEWDDLSSTPCFYVVGIGRDSRNVPGMVTPPQLYPLELPLTPVLTLGQQRHDVGKQAGELSIDFEVENPLPDEGLVFEVDPAGSWITSIVEEQGKIKIAYDANHAAVSRSVEIMVKYRYAQSRTITINQAADMEQEPITFEIEVLESHFNHILVNVTPSDTSVKYVLNSISKSYFEGPRYGGDDQTLWRDELSDPYYKAPIYSGVKQNHRISVAPGDYYGWLWYVYAYAVSDDEVMAISDIEKVLVEVLDDEPTLSFPSSKMEVPAEGGIIEVPYTLTNPIEGGSLRIDGVPMNSYNVLDASTLVVDTEKQVVRFKVNPYDPEQKYHDATIFIGYFENESATKSICGASLRLEQKAPAK